jgi:small GTP-binding protein
MKLNNNIEELRELIARPSELQVAVYGKYNHGKSSLLNALVEKEVFKTADIRETVTIQAHTKDKITWVDTPGLDADVYEKDDSKAKKILKKSDLLLFVHSVNEGELDEKELNFLKERYETNNNILLILSQTDKIAEVETVQNIIEEQLEFMINTIQIIAVSSKRASHKNEKIRNMSNIKNISQIIHQKREKLLKNRDIEKNSLKKEIQISIDEKIANLNLKKAKVSTEIFKLKEEFEKDVQNIPNKNGSTGDIFGNMQSGLL